MRIGVDACCWGNRRGYGRFTRELLEKLVELDTDNEYYFFIDSENEEIHTLPVGVTTIIAKTTESPVAAASANGNRRLRDIWAMTRQVLRYDLNIFFFPTVYSYYPILNRTKVLVGIHDMIADHHPELVFRTARSKYFWKVKQRAAVWRADLVATVSNHSKEQIKKYFGLSEARVRIISEGATSNFMELPSNNGFIKTREKYGVGDEDELLLYVGGISPHKNLSRLVDAFAILCAEVDGKRPKLLLAGDYKDDPFLSAYPNLKSKVNALGLGDSVKFTGYVPDDELVYLYNAATVVVLPSLEEGFGLPALEGMACGAPVVSSDRGSLPEVMGDAGRYFDPYRPQNIADVLKQVLCDEKLRSSMKARGLDRAKSFSWTTSANQAMKIFDELAGAGNSD